MSYLETTSLRSLWSKLFFGLLLVATPSLGQQFAHVSIIGVDTCMVVTGNVAPLYMATSSCVESNEAKAAQRLRVSATLANMECIADGDPGAGKSITITGRSGACGSLTDSTFACTLTGGSGIPNCNTGTGKLVVASAGQCWDLKLTF